MQIPSRFSIGGTVICGLLMMAPSVAQDSWSLALGTASSDQVGALSSDDFGGIFVTGETSGSLFAPFGGVREAWVARIDGSGQLLWGDQFGAPEAQLTTDITSDGEGGAYVCGYLEPAMGAFLADPWLARYDSQGNQVWHLTILSGDSHSVQGVAPDGNGGVFVAGGSNSPGAMGPWLAHYQASGQQSWIRWYTSTTLSRFSAMAPDGRGGVITGLSTARPLGSGFNDYDTWVARFDSQGTLFWRTEFTTPRWEWIESVALGLDEDVFITGFTAGDLANTNQGDVDIWIARVDLAGNRLWTRQFGSTTRDWPMSVAPDGLGGAYVCGWTWGSLTSGASGTEDSWFAHYDGAGNQVELRQFGTTQRDQAVGLWPDRTGGLFLAGSTGGDIAGSNQGLLDAWVLRTSNAAIDLYCHSAASNSAGSPAQIQAWGSNVLGSNSLRIGAYSLPPQTFGFFLTSQTQGFVPQVGGSQGALCLSGNIGRFNGPGQVLNSGPTGCILLDVDLLQIPHPSGPLAIQVGETWNFQAWYRDQNPLPTSNLSDAISVTFE